MDLKERSKNPHRHPWELSRADMMLRLLSTNQRETSYVDIGSGDLYIARRLTETTDAQVFAVDVNYATRRSEDRVVICTNLDQVPPKSVDCAVLMDVLEHVDDDVALLREVDRVLKRQSRVLITVPAHVKLWSDHDVFLGHRRRYERQQLLEVIQQAGLAVVECFYFYHLPYLGRLAEVVLGGAFAGRRYQSSLSLWPYSAEHLATRIVRTALNVDFRLSRRQWFGWSTRGLSLCAVCQRQSA